MENYTTVLGNAINSLNGNPEYDQNVKQLLALKPVLARILKGTAHEFMDMELEDIENAIEGTPHVSSVPVEPGLTNSKIFGMDKEETIANEGYVTFDVKFYARYPNMTKNEPVKIIVDVEAQKDYYPGYDIVTRGIFYAARSISSQKEREFTNSDYQNIKKVYSIWICTTPPKSYSNSIVEYSLKENILMGDVKPMHTFYDLISVVLVMLPSEDYEEDVPSLPGFLRTLLSSNKSKQEKIERLVEFYGISLSENLERTVDAMCNLSFDIEEKALQKGFEQGINKGINQIVLIVNALREGKSEQELRVQYGDEAVDAAKSIL